MTENNNQFDLLLIDSGMSDVDVHTFLRITKDMDVLSVVMSEKEDEAFINEVLKSGAFLVVKTPLSLEAMGYIRQDIMRKRMRKHEICNQQSSNHDDGYNDDSSMKEKICMVWTEEVHERFIKAVSVLGDGRCFPKKILGIMGVPSLTRSQVASHLQKCRREKLNLKDKKTPQNIALPSLETNQKNDKERNTFVTLDKPNNGCQTQVNHMKKDSSMMTKSNHKNTSQQIEYTPIPFGSDLVINQGNRFGSKVTSAGGNFFEQIIPAFGDVGHASNEQNVSCIPTQEFEEFHEFLKDFNGSPNEI